MENYKKVSFKLKWKKEWHLWCKVLCKHERRGGKYYYAKLFKTKILAKQAEYYGIPFQNQFYHILINFITEQPHFVF